MWLSEIFKKKIIWYLWSRQKKSITKGQSLIEVLVALSLVSIVALALVKVVISSVRNTNFSTDQSQATALAQKKISDIANISRTEAGFWSNPSNYSGTEILNNGYYCLKTTVSEATSTPGLIPTNSPNYGKTKVVWVKVVVYWEQSGSGSMCNGKDYKHFLSFDRYLYQ